MSAGVHGGFARTTTDDDRLDRSVDRLTGLAVREELLRRGPQLLGQPGGHGPAAVLVLDLDDFKVLNDSAGHHVGDAVLAAVGARLRRTVGPEDLVVRLGGDEFAVVTAPLRHRDEAAGLAAALIAAVGQPLEVDELRLGVGVSVGIAVHDEDGGTVEELLRAADQAMYAAKAAGTGQWRASTPEALRSTGVTRRLLDDLRAGRAAEQLVLHYQPQVDLETGDVVGFEALARWDHPELGLLPPRHFIPLAERSGLMAPLGAAVLDRALGDLPRLQEHAPGARLSINVTPRHILGTGLVDDLTSRVHAHGASPEDVVLEITEPLTRTSPETTATFEELSRRGFGISIRGFGTARSSLTVLWSNPAVREVKVDPSIVAAIAEDGGAEATAGRRRTARLVRALASAARGLGIRVVAEGAEDPSSFALLHELGCEVVQGFAVSQPVAVDEVVRWCRARQAEPVPG
ncbi:putative bifunctional diguanylate cyclase/phosphodiesterase [Nocardioides dongxiaopingii]|uniref:putative bifunctional diguanylate cyclase/phosphodiesterase n=1 Tax=Nocardioides dongxiaopingii TaxID=2576036 RepID=UPI0014850704|nr:bifunctional diguanylate cyclase/phosphodiesterase [Nocardioides dongxiaopingii]